VLFRSIELAQGRGRGRFGVGPSLVTPSQLDRLETSGLLASEAEARVREVDPVWRPEPTLSDPTNIESRITRNEHLMRQANERFAEIRTLQFGQGVIPESDRPLGILTGPRYRENPRDDAETNRGRGLENYIADILWLNRHNVAQLRQSSSRQGVKQPDLLVDNELFDAYSPSTNRVRNAWHTTAEKISKQQAPNIVVYLGDAGLELEAMIAQFRTYRIPGLRRLWLVDRQGKLHYLF
jgi:hypothetical protein